MGSHSNAPSKLKNFEPLTTLKHFIQTYPRDLLSEEVCKGFGSNDLPFLFKVLSVRKALSIQAHPDKLLAERLHSNFPEHYPDGNHKPEMAIAFDKECRALVGFRPIEEIAIFLEIVPELSDLLGIDLIQEFKSTILKPYINDDESKDDYLHDALKKLFTTFINLPLIQLKEVLQSHITRIKQSLEYEKTSLLLDAYSCVLSLYEEFPEDVGVWSVYWFNHVHLKPMESIYLGANEPHAYLSGTFIECMSTSDNVVRAGLTSKFRDLKTFCEMLTYECRPSIDQICVPQQFDYSILTKTSLQLFYYQPKCHEFRVLYISAHKSHEATLFSIPDQDFSFQGPCIMLVVEGHSDHHVRWYHFNSELTFGKIFFIAAGTFHLLEFFLGSNEPLKIFVASCGNLVSSSIKS